MRAVRRWQTARHDDRSGGHAAVDHLTGRAIAPSAGDGYTRASAQYDFEVAGRDVRELLVALVSSDSYRHLRVPTD